MPSKYNPTDANNYRLPSVTGFNRLLPIPVSIDYERNLRAEVQDPLWFIARQWQMGEFIGEDAGAPAFAKVTSSQAEPKSLRLNQNRNIAAEPYNFKEAPLEVLVEREPFLVTVHMRVQAGFYFQKLLRLNNLLQHLPKIIERCPLPADNLPDWDTEGQQLLAGCRPNIPDGFLLATDGSIPNWIQSTFPGNNPPAFQALVTDLGKWLNRTYPSVNAANTSAVPTAWKTGQMEYAASFEMTDAATGRLSKLKAESYMDGQLDWSDFNWSGDASLPNAVTETETFIPTPVRYQGMPNPRFWEMEEGRVNFGAVSMSPSNVLSMAFVEFGLSYSNDWFWIPMSLKINSLCRIAQIEVTNVFGDKTVYAPKADNGADPLTKFNLFQLAGDNDTVQQLLYLPPTIMKVQESEPIERVYFLRDEQSNLAWAVETIVPGSNQRGVPMKTVNPNPPDPVEATELNYFLGNTVPENWIPFIPVRLNNAANPNQTRLQRGRMPGGKPPKGQVLQDVPVGKQYLIREEEVSRAGTIVERSWQRARWLNGKTFTWIGRRKTSGRIENTNELTWDWVVRR